VGQLDQVRTYLARAALEPWLLPEALWQMREALGGEMATIERFDKRTASMKILGTDRLDLIAIGREAYESYYHKVNPRHPLLLGSPQGSLLTDDLVGDDAVLARDEFHVDFLASHGLRYFVGSPIVQNADLFVAPAIHRTPAQGRVDDEEARLFMSLMPDMAHAIAFHTRINEVPADGILADVLDLFADPVAVVDRDAAVLFANGAMRDLFVAGDLVRIEDGRMRSNGPAMSDALARVMREVLRGARSVGAELHRGNGFGPTLLRAVVLEGDRGRGFGSCEDRLVCLLIDDPERPDWPGIERAMAMFGLTRQEAAVGMQLVAGRAVEEIAHRLGVSRNTVRTHVAALRSKLEVRTSLAVAARLGAVNGPFGCR